MVLVYEGLAMQEIVPPDFLCVLGATRSNDFQDATLELVARSDADDDQLEEGTSDCIWELRHV